MAQAVASILNHLFSPLCAQGLPTGYSCVSGARQGRKPTLPDGPRTLLPDSHSIIHIIHCVSYVCTYHNIIIVYIQIFDVFHAPVREERWTETRRRGASRGRTLRARGPATRGGRTGRVRGVLRLGAGTFAPGDCFVTMPKDGLRNDSAAG